MRTLLSVLIMIMMTSGPVFAQAECSQRERNRLERAFFGQMNEHASQIVWLGSDKSATILSCRRYSDGFVVTGRFHMYGLDDAYYWVEGRMIANRSFGPIGSEVTNANGNFISLMLIKGATIVGLAAGVCAADPDAC